MDYTTHDVSDLLLDDAFVAWAKTGTDDPFWQTFLEKHPDRRPTVEQALTLVRAAASLPATYPDAAEVDELWGAIQRATTDEPSTPVVPLRRWPVWSYWAAASVAVLLLAGLALFRQPQNVPLTYRELVAKTAQPLREIHNEGPKTRLVPLADGSTVLLQPGSRLSYPTVFAGQARREVYLSGEAFFEVTKTPRQPFVVYANELVTKVLGTSFTVRAFEGESKITVVVKTGRVSVFAQNDAEKSRKLGQRELDGLVLTPNQRIAYERAEARLTRSLVEQPQLLPHPVQRLSFDFDDTPVPAVFATLEQAYGVDIVYDEEVLKDCKLTASLGDEPLFEKIRLLCVSLEATYERMDGQIVIHAKGCSNL